MADQGNATMVTRDKDKDKLSIDNGKAVNRERSIEKDNSETDNDKMALTSNYVILTICR